MCSQKSYRLPIALAKFLLASSLLGSGAIAACDRYANFDYLIPPFDMECRGSTECAGISMMFLQFLADVVAAKEVFMQQALNLF